MKAVPLSIFHATTKDTELMGYNIPKVNGPQMCLRESLAHMELFFALVTLLRRFTFIWPEDAGEPDFTPIYGATLTPKPYCMKIQRRKSQEEVSRLSTESERSGPNGCKDG
ncbi:cytochrome P450 2U1-like [Echeneis naucrates]|uniref:cytochrome P450 2U1-like n=1 Tax=Echeneis naucrates TaxID=173247 RepID=UPI0011141477|nr:cytochrome P450 2U1-like [Echeneis naucrates]